MAGRKGQSGPRKKPTSILKLEGRFDKNPQRKREEVEPTGDAIKPKRFKTQLERKAWERIVPPLMAMGLATNADQLMLEKLCYWLAKHEQYAYDDANFGVSERAWKQFERIAVQFGMTPSARAGLQVSNAKKQLDEVEAMLA